MKPRRFIIACLVLMGGNLLLGQSYDEQRTRAQLEKYQANPKLYYDKIKALTDKLEEANKSTLKMSEEYLDIIDRKDSVINAYRSQMGRVRGGKMEGKVVKEKQSLPPIDPENTTFRVQIAAFGKEEFMKYFKDGKKTFGVQKLENRSVMEIHGFDSEDEAKVFATKMRGLGFPGAFVTRYDNGERVEGFKGSSEKESNKEKEETYKVSANLDASEYPDYIPIGYQELLGDKNKQMLAASSTPPPLKNVPKPLTEVTPNQSDVDRGIVVPEGALNAASSGRVGQAMKKPSVAASTKPTATADKTKKPTSTSTAKKETNQEIKPINADKVDPLDEALDKLFKK